MTNTFSQLDHGLMARVRFEADLEPRMDRRIVIYAGLSVFEAIDRLTPKKLPLSVNGRRCRVNELLITWRGLSRASGWTEGRTALRDVVGRFAPPFYIQLPWAPDGTFKGIRILRMHHAGRGVIAHAYDDKKPAEGGRILCGIWITLERIFHLHAQKGSARLIEMERLVDRLLARRVPRDGFNGDLGWEPPPSFCAGCGETYRGLGDPALFDPGALATRIVSRSAPSTTVGTAAHTCLATG